MTGILKVDQWKDSGDNALMTSDGAGNLTANVSFTSPGITLSDNILFNTASKGVYLGVTSATASNLLDDYEEGSFTPSLDIETGASITINTIQGYYRKIGNLVAFTIYCDWDKTAGSANVKFTGLPFTSSNQTNLTRQAVEWQQGAYTDQGALTGGAVFQSSTDVYFVDSKYGSFNTNFDTNNGARIANTTGIRSFVNGTYFTT